MHSKHTDYLSYFEGPAGRFLESIMQNMNHRVDGGILSMCIQFLKPKAEAWKIVDQMDKYFANFLGTSDYLYFKKEAFEHCCTTLKKKYLEGTLDTFTALSNAEFQVIPGVNVFTGYYGPHGLLQACLKYHDANWPSPPIPFSGDRNEEDDEVFEGGSEGDEVFEGGI